MRAAILLLLIPILEGAISFQCGPAANPKCLVYCEAGKALVRLETTVGGLESGGELMSDAGDSHAKFITDVCTHFCGGINYTDGMKPSDCPT